MLVRWFGGWILVCLGALVGCGDSDVAEPDDTEQTGDTELEVIVANANLAVPVVEYTIVCTGDPEVAQDDISLNGNLELTTAFLDNADQSMWNGFIDLPAGPCSIQLRIRNDNGEVICSHDDAFDVAGLTPQVSILMVCAETPIAVFNICPDLFPVECLEFEEGTSVTSCELIFRDEDGTCEQSCDPQTCVAVPTGLECTPGPDPGVSTTITCEEDALDCEGDGALDASCTFRDSRESFTVDCAPTDGEDFTGSTVTCTVVVTDGDADCDMREVVEVECPGAAP